VAGSPGLVEIVGGSDGALWFTQYNRHAIGRMTTAGSYSEFPVPAPSDAVGQQTPNGIAAGPDGNVWFTSNAGDSVGRVTPGGTVTVFELPGFATRFGAGRTPTAITAGPDGAMWFIETSPAAIARITTSGAVTEFPLAAGRSPYDIAPGPDGQLWFTDFANTSVVRMATDGTITGDFPLPTPSSGARGITAGPDGAIWAVEGTRGKFARITPAGAVTEVEGGASSMTNIKVGPDNALYATGPEGPSDGPINRSDGGPVERDFAPAGTNDLTLGSDGALWMVESSVDRLLRVVPSQVTPAPPTPPGPANPPSTPTPPVRRCVVPNLLNLSLTSARRRLRTAHCRLGRVSTARSARRIRRSRLRVIAQSPRRRAVRADNASVRVTLGRARR
jgi:streptogramin lyase